MDGLIERAIKALEHRDYLSEITLTDGSMSVHIARFTSAPCTLSRWYQADSSGVLRVVSVGDNQPSSEHWHLDAEKP